MADKKRRQALGRGLSSLIPVFDEETPSDADIAHIDVELITPNPFQPRKRFDEEEIAHLAESIKSQGLLQPLLLRRRGASYEIISGERRLRALRHIGEKKAPALIKDKVSDSKMLEMALVENIQREDLNEIETAVSYQKLLLECGLSHHSLSERVGKSRSAITNTLRLLKLPEQIQNMVREGILSAGHARAVASLKDRRDQCALAEKIADLGLSVREVEQIARHTTDKSPPVPGKSRALKDPDIQQLEAELRYRFGADVALIMRSGNKGKIEISYCTREDLERIIGILRG